MKPSPPLPILRSLVLTTILVWAIPRGILATGAKAMARRYDISSDLSGLVLLLLALGVSWVVLFDASRSRTRIFCQNLGVAPTTLFLLAFCTVVACEVVLAFGSTLLRSLGGG